MRPRDRRVAAVALALGTLVGLGPAPSRADDLPIVDTHIHYSQDAWGLYSPEAVLGILEQAGVRRAFVSSTPDEGTLRLHAAAPDRVVPVLRPYREAGQLASWHRDPTVVPYLEARLARGIYRGIGEFHLDGAAAGAPVVRQVGELAARHGLFLHCHCDGAAVETLLGVAPTVRILWAHAGMSAGADTVGRLLDRFPRLAVELALRSDVAPGGALDPAWRAVFLRHPGRVMVGTDTWVPSRWADLPATQVAIRAWLRQLPEEVARGLAWENAERLARPTE